MAGSYEERQAASTHPGQPDGDAHVPGRLRELLGSRVEREVYLSPRRRRRSS